MLDNLSIVREELEKGKRPPGNFLKRRWNSPGAFPTNSTIISWEYMNCGREQGGENADRIGVCPAAADSTWGEENHPFMRHIYRSKREDNCLTIYPTHCRGVGRGLPGFIYGFVYILSEVDGKNTESGNHHCDNFLDPKSFVYLTTYKPA